MTKSTETFDPCQPAVNRVRCKIGGAEGNGYIYSQCLLYIQARLRQVFWENNPQHTSSPPASRIYQDTFELRNRFYHAFHISQHVIYPHANKSWWSHRIFFQYLIYLIKNFQQQRYNLYLLNFEKQVIVIGLNWQIMAIFSQ